MRINWDKAVVFLIVMALWFGFKELIIWVFNQ